MVLSLAYAILASSYEFSNMMQPYLLVYMQAAEMKREPLQKLKQRIRKITPMCHMLHVFPSNFYITTFHKHILNSNKHKREKKNDERICVYDSCSGGVCCNTAA